jgi:hypothetical protein
VSTALYRWPVAARFGRVVPKSKFYQHSSLSPTARELFVDEVQRITWAFKLADETIHLRGNAAVPEIQVFSIDAKDQDVRDAVLTVIDKAISFPIIFEINRFSGEQAQSRMVAAYKRLDGVNLGISGYFSTEWVPADSPRVPMPAGLNLSGLYAGLLTPILPIATRPGEGLSEVAGRMDQARKLEREIAILEKTLRSQPQLNRKVELRRIIRDRTAVLNALGNRSRDMTEDAPWTN